jgi:hypothetical protein
MEVVLSQEEIDEALDFVNRMRDDKVEHRVVDKKFDAKNTSWAVNLMGYLGEKAVAKAYQVPVDRRVLTGGDEGHDLVINNKKIQVKTSTLDKLIFNALELFTADYAILVTLIGDRQQPHINSKFKIWGAISKEDFMRVCYQKDYGYGVRFVCDTEHIGASIG